MVQPDGVAERVDARRARHTLQHGHIREPLTVNSLAQRCQMRGAGVGYTHAPPGRIHFDRFSGPCIILRPFAD
jgi:hypothetical protein